FRTYLTFRTTHQIVLTKCQNVAVGNAREPNDLTLERRKNGHKKRNPNHRSSHARHTPRLATPIPSNIPRKEPANPLIPRPSRSRNRRSARPTHQNTPPATRTWPLVDRRNSSTRRHQHDFPHTRSPLRKRRTRLIPRPQLRRMQ